MLSRLMGDMKLLCQWESRRILVKRTVLQMKQMKTNVKLLSSIKMIADNLVQINSWMAKANSGQPNWNHTFIKLIKNSSIWQLYLTALSDLLATIHSVELTAVDVNRERAIWTGSEEGLECLFNARLYIQWIPLCFSS